VNKLILPSNGLKGQLSPEIGKLTELVEIDLRDNYIAGSLPEELCYLNKLEGLYLYANSFTGRIPDGLADLPNLKGIYLFTNSFEGCNLFQFIFCLNLLSIFRLDVERSRNLFKAKLKPGTHIFV
jgi:Leucine-rich repeat (LRR) protein